MIATTRRRMQIDSRLGMALVAISLAFSPPSAQAQTFKVCGDADGSGSVTVTDGVQVLRAASGLSSTCTNEVCDVDLNGAISVTDGVITLRKAADLPITQNCIPDEGNLGRQVQHLVQRTQPLVSDALGTLVLRRDVRVDETFNCENGEDGTLEVTIDGQLDMSFDNCLVNHSFINGTAEDAGDDPLLSLEVIDGATEESISFEGDSSLLGVNTIVGVKLSGNLNATPTFDQFETGDFLLVVGSLEFAPTGTPVAGSITIVLNEDSNVPGVERVRIVYDGSNLARVVVTADDASVTNHRFDLITRRFR